jgi:hypothetical protein
MSVVADRRSVVIIVSSFVCKTSVGQHPTNERLHDADRAVDAARASTTSISTSRAVIPQCRTTSHDGDEEDPRRWATRVQSRITCTQQTASPIRGWRALLEIV